jgi:hypothetical protein
MEREGVEREVVTGEEGGEGGREGGGREGWMRGGENLQSLEAVSERLELT